MYARPRWSPAEHPSDARARALHSGTVPCLNITVDIPDWGGCCGWDYLACTILYQPQAQRGMWWPATTWNLTADMEACQQQFGVQLRPHWAIAEFGGLDFHASSNIIFSQGLLDPWHTSGVTSSQVWPPRAASLGTAV